MDRRLNPDSSERCGLIRFFLGQFEEPPHGCLFGGPSAGAADHRHPSVHFPGNQFDQGLSLVQAQEIVLARHRRADDRAGAMLQGEADHRLLGRDVDWLSLVNNVGITGSTPRSVGSPLTDSGFTSATAFVFMDGTEPSGDCG